MNFVPLLPNRLSCH